MIELANVSKNFGDLAAVSHLTLTIARGEFFAMLGPNAAGKTTTLKILAGLMKPTSGHARICGLDVYKRQRNGSLKTSSKPTANCSCRSRGCRKSCGSGTPISPASRRRPEPTSRRPPIPAHCRPPARCRMTFHRNCRPPQLRPCQNPRRRNPRRTRTPSPPAKRPPPSRENMASSSTRCSRPIQVWCPRTCASGRSSTFPRR